MTPLPSASALAAQLRSGTLDPVDLLDAHLARIEALNPALNAVVTLNPRAREEAEIAREALRRGEGGPLCGLPVGIKDVTPVRGLRTTYGCPLFRDHVPTEDGPAVRRLRAAGAVILGKTNTPELATGGHTDNALFGPTRNPWDLERSPGGSTGGGAAALAAGLIALAEGTDMGGSLRIPAAFCGVFGLRPTPGLVPTGPLRDDSLQVSGPMARTSADLALALDALADSGSIFREAHQQGLSEDLRLGWCPDLSGRGVEEELVAVAEAALAPLRPRRAALDLSRHHETFAALRAAWMVEQHLPLLDRLEALGDNVRGNIERGLALDMVTLARARRARRDLQAQMASLFEGLDVLITPTVATPAFRVADGPPTQISGRPMQSYIDWVAPTYLISLTGCPAMSVPVGLDARGMPVGVQLIGPPRGEARLLAVAAAVESRVGPLTPPRP
ncbi:MAG: amidase [Alphaproteobacteria bacterium]|nr:amidase [Alphaproteobacteria bacterium]